MHDVPDVMKKFKEKLKTWLRALKHDLRNVVSAQTTISVLRGTLERIHLLNLAAKERMQLCLHAITSGIYMNDQKVTQITYQDILTNGWLFICLSTSSLCIPWIWLNVLQVLQLYWMSQISKWDALECRRSSNIQILSPSPVVEIDDWMFCQNHPDSWGSQKYCWSSVPLWWQSCAPSVLLCSSWYLSSIDLRAMLPPFRFCPNIIVPLTNVSVWWSHCRFAS